MTLTWWLYIDDKGPCDFYLCEFSSGIINSALYLLSSKLCFEIYKLMSPVLLMKMFTGPYS